MSRLISVDELIDYLGFENTDEEREENVGEIITLEDIDKIPTAYDLDKVLERLERLKRTNEVNQCYATATGFRQAIEIVKAGIAKAVEAESVEEADE